MLLKILTSSLWWHHFFSQFIVSFCFWFSQASQHTFSHFRDSKPLSPLWLISVPAVLFWCIISFQHFSSSGPTTLTWVGQSYNARPGCWAQLKEISHTLDLALSSHVTSSLSRSSCVCNYFSSLWLDVFPTLQITISTVLFFSWTPYFTLFDLKCTLLICLKCMHTQCLSAFTIFPSVSRSHPCLLDSLVAELW